MKLKLDENLGLSALRTCQDAGHDTSTIYLQQMAGASDNVVHEVCRSEDRVLVTLDLDFANPLVFDPRGSAGCAVLRLPKNAGSVDVTAVLTSLLDALTDMTSPDNYGWFGTIASASGNRRTRRS